MVYKTKQKDVIFNVIKNYPKEFTSKDIYEKVKDKTGLTTVYRVIEKLYQDGFLKKSVKDNHETYYQYLEKCDCENHFYLKCRNCQKLIHIDCDCIKDLSFHIKEKHQFKINQEQIIIDGICAKCEEGDKK